MVWPRSGAAHGHAAPSLHFWDTRPDIIAQVSTSEAATADPKDASAFVSRPSPLDVLAAPACRKRDAKKSRSRKQKQAQGGLDTDSEEPESSGSSDVDDDFGKPCRDSRGRAYKNCTKCSFFKRHKVCKFYHADAPAGTTGAKATLNKKSLAKLNKLGAFGRKGRKR